MATEKKNLDKNANKRFVATKHDTSKGKPSKEGKKAFNNAFKQAGIKK